MNAASAKETYVGVKAAESDCDRRRGNRCGEPVVKCCCRNSPVEQTSREARSGHSCDVRVRRTLVVVGVRTTAATGDGVDRI